MIGRVRARSLGGTTQVEADGHVRVHEIGDPEVAGGRVPGDDRIAVEAERGERGRKDAATVRSRSCSASRARPAPRPGGDPRQDARRQHPLQGVGLRPRRVGEERGDAGQRLVRLRVEHVQDRAARAGCAPSSASGPCVSFSPVGSTRMSATFWVSLTSLRPRRISSSGLNRNRVDAPWARSATCATELPPPPGGQRPVLLLDVVDEDRMRPGEQRRDDEADAFAASASARSRRRARDRRGG